MKNKITKLIAILLLCLITIGVFAQEAIPATGGNATGSGGSVSYTVGQVFYTIHIGSNGSTAQGIQHPFEISVIIGTVVTNDIILTCYAYPNPTSRFVMLAVENYRTKNMTYHLYDNSGKLLENKSVDGNETLIDMSNLIVASYILKVSVNNKVIKAFRIIKY